MADTKKGQKTNNSDDDTLRAGVSPQEEKEARKDSRETSDQPALNEQPTEEEDEIPDGLLKELPSDGAVVSQAGVLVGTEEQALRGASVNAPLNAAYGETVFSHPYSGDEFTGQGGSFVIDPDTGDRKRQYEAVRDRNGKILGYRPVV